MRFARLILFGFITIAVVSCKQKANLDSLRSEILELHRCFIQAHLDKDAAFIAKPTSPDYLFVANGLVQNMNADHMEQMLAEYLNSTKFSEYKDVEDPVIGISNDGTLAWAIVQVRVAGQRTRSDNSIREFDTVFAWITLFQRNGNEWLRIADVSTNRQYEEQL